MDNALNGYCPDYLLPKGFVKKCTAPTQGSTSTAPTPAVQQSATVENGGWVVLRNVAAGNCLTDQRKAGAVSRPCDTNAPDQQFKFEHTGNGQFKVVARSGYLWDIESYSRNNGAKLLTWDNNNESNQRFTVQKVGANYMFKAVNSGKCVDVSNGNTADYAIVQQYDCQDSNNNMKWFAIEATGPFTSHKLIMIKDKTGKCWKANGHGGCLQHRNCNKDDQSQRFKFEWTTNGYKIIRDGGKPLDVYGNNNDNGKCLVEWDDTGGNNQRFWIIKNKNKIQIMARHSWKCADLAAGNAADNAVIQQHDCDKNNTNQDFEAVEF